MPYKDKRDKQAHNKKYRETHVAAKRRYTTPEYRAAAKARRDAFTLADRARLAETARRSYVKRREALALKWSVKRALRRARKLQATPPWLVQEHKVEIADIYAAARSTGLVVDHIVPLRGKYVSGLHVPWNLQILTVFANASKGAKHCV